MRKTARYSNSRVCPSVCLLLGQNLVSSLQFLSAQRRHRTHNHISYYIEITDSILFCHILVKSARENHYLISLMKENYHFSFLVKLNMSTPITFIWDTRMTTSISSKDFCSITDRQNDKIFT